MIVQSSTGSVGPRQRDLDPRPDAMAGAVDFRTAVAAPKTNAPPPGQIADHRPARADAGTSAVSTTNSARPAGSSKSYDAGLRHSLATGARLITSPSSRSTTSY